MCKDLLEEAKGEIAIGGVTHRLLLALGFDDPEHNQRTGILENQQTSLPDQEDEGMDAEGRRHP